MRLPRCDSPRWTTPWILNSGFWISLFPYAAPVFPSQSFVPAISPAWLAEPHPIILEQTLVFMQLPRSDSPTWTNPWILNSEFSCSYTAITMWQPHTDRFFPIVFHWNDILFSKLFEFYYYCIYIMLRFSYLTMFQEKSPLQTASGIMLYNPFSESF